VKRRKFFKQTLQAAAATGAIAATFYSGYRFYRYQTGIRQSPWFSLDLRRVTTPLPEHLLTDIEDFYVQSYGLLTPQLKAEDWQLKIAGEVEKPIALRFEDILQAQPQDEFYLTMECIGNQTGGNLIGNALWVGTPLLPFLEQAGVRNSAQEFLLKGADGYETSLPIAEVSRPDVRLVHRMNGEPLPAKHGYPVRLIVPGHFGQKQPKWITDIVAIPQRTRGYWERQGWSNTAEIPTHSLPRQVQQEQVWTYRHRLRLARTGPDGWQGGVLIAGVALDGRSPIQTVRVSTDNGKTWTAAEQNYPESPHEWTLWRYRWHPKEPGEYTILARAESDRSLQLVDDPQPRDGSTGILRIQAMLKDK